MTVDSGPQGAELDVSRETKLQLERFATLLKRWNAKINLVSRSSLGDLWGRHIMDSAQLFALMPPSARSWADLGSGGGFPGLVIAILAQQAGADLAVTLVESDGRKAAFLAAAVHELGLSATVRTDRIEALAPLGADVISARALAPLSQLLGYCARHGGQGSRALLLKGAGFAEELKEARENWRFDLVTHPSKTAPDSVILDIGALSHG